LIQLALEQTRRYLTNKTWITTSCRRHLPY